MTTDPQTAADEPRRFLTAWINAGQPNTIAVAGGHMLTVPQVGALLAERARMAAELEQSRRELNELLIADGSVDNEPYCECGCLPGQLCDCTVHDCECIGDCPVCDADGMTYAIDAAETTATRPASALTDPPEGQRLSTAADGPQRGAGDDEEGGDRG